MALIYFLWDASAGAKRYAPEIGSDVVDALFALEASHPVLTVLGYSETFAIFLRKHNAGAIGQPAFHAGISALENDFLNNPDAVLLSITDAITFASLSMIQRHNLNSADAAILTTFLQYRATLSEKMVLVSSDKRLIRAAQSEGFVTLNPEELDLLDLPAFIADL